MVSVTEQQVQPVGVEEKPDFENEACTNLSTIIATTSERMDSLKKKRMEIEELREDLKTAIDVEKALENEVPNLTVQIQEIQDTCTDFVPQDCCQVHYKSHLK